MDKNAGVNMKHLRRERRARGECSNCKNHSGKFYLCSSCRDKSRKRQIRFKKGIKKATRDPRRLDIWDLESGNNELMNALSNIGISFSAPDQLKLFANLMNRSSRTVQGWIFEGRVPQPSLWKQIEIVLNKPISVLFPQLRNQLSKENKVVN
ncbi:hypothetical protein EHV15_35805 [Paenibacillus oralis]|uniref:Uncharacterized protein n=1 Tax=Paenibacillus oralis TaxID=2490856 RepID=A0A3P3TCU9_9BACL|nr:hypothetical protein [Paenibacillus oralis]RRJ54938.1 hypothetical protein EHV15_35805 [Paenibacillus oralis]